MDRDSRCGAQGMHARGSYRSVANTVAEAGQTTGNRGVEGRAANAEAKSRDAGPCAPALEFTLEDPLVAQFVLRTEESNKCSPPVYPSVVCRSLADHFTARSGAQGRAVSAVNIFPGGYMTQRR